MPIPSSVRSDKDVPVHADRVRRVEVVDSRIRLTRDDTYQSWILEKHGRSHEGCGEPNGERSHFQDDEWPIREGTVTATRNVSKRR